jgi:hypothetical protein
MTMQFNRDEYLLLSRGGRVPCARSKGPPPDPPPEPERERAAIRRPVRRRPLVDSLLVAASVTRATILGAQEQRRSR